MRKSKNKQTDVLPIMSGPDDLYNFLYAACNILRGPVGHENFKAYLTPLLYFKRICDVWEEETKAALELSGGDVEFANCPEQHTVIIPEGCHWEDIRQRSENIGSAIVEALRTIERYNPETLYGVLSVFSSANFTDKNILSDATMKSLVEHLSKRHLGNKDYSADLMGDAYEILLKKFADESKAKAGEFYTPRPVVRLLVRILDPQPGESVYDPACGSGGMLIEAVHYMKNSTLCCGRIFGQEKNVTNAAISKMNLFLHGASDFRIMQGDTLRNPRILANGELAKFDCVVANPPFSLKEWGATAFSSDIYGRNIWGTPPDSNGDFAWLQHMITSMRPGKGRMAVVLPQGVLFRGDVEARIREKLVESDLIDCIITLGDKLFYGTQLSPCILILRQVKDREHVGKILMMDASKIYTPQRAQNVLSDENINEIFHLYEAYEDREELSKIVSLEEIASRNYELSVNRYIQYKTAEIRSYADVKAEFDAAIADVRQATERFTALLAQEGYLK